MKETTVTNPLALRLRQVLELDEQRDASNWCISAGVAPSLISSFFVRAANNPKASLSANSLAKLASAAEVDFMWLASGVGAMRGQHGEPVHSVPPPQSVDPELQAVNSMSVSFEEKEKLLPMMEQALEVQFAGSITHMAETLEVPPIWLQGVIDGDNATWPTRELLRRFRRVAGHELPSADGNLTKVEHLFLEEMVKESVDVLQSIADQEQEKGLRSAVALAGMVLKHFGDLAPEAFVERREPAAEASEHLARFRRRHPS